MNSLSSFSYPYVIVNTDTNNAFLQITNHCLFPLEMHEPWNNLSLSDFICKESQLNETIRTLNNKIAAIRQGHYHSNIQLEAMKHLESNKQFDLDDMTFFNLEYQNEQ